MKRLTAFVTALMISGFISACGTITVTTPPGSKVVIADKGQAGIAGCTLYSQKRYMYLLWGLVPLGDNTTTTIMPKKGKVVVETKTTVIDGILNILANSLIPTTLYFNTAEVYKCTD